MKTSLGLKFLLATLLAATCCGLHAKSNTATLENEALRVVFDLDTGRYSAVEKATGTVLFQNATMRLGSWDMSNAGMVAKRSAELVPVEDGLGKGRTLRVTAEMAHNFAGWLPDKPGRSRADADALRRADRSGARRRYPQPPEPADQERSNP